MLDKILKERLDLIAKFQVIFQSEIEPTMTSRYIRRGSTQGKLFKACNLPRNGLFMKLANEAIQSLGYKLTRYNGWPMYKKR